jgi:hypothetical protein
MTVVTRPEGAVRVVNYRRLAHRDDCQAQAVAGIGYCRDPDDGRMLIRSWQRQSAPVRAAGIGAIGSHASA